MCAQHAILITHQLEEAIGVGDRVVVFGKSAKLLADIHVNKWPKTKYAACARRFRRPCKATSPIRGCTTRPSCVQVSARSARMPET